MGRKCNKGFTLVELIVVLVILAILAAILVPALLGYIDRAKDQQYVIQAREFMMATQAGISEVYAQKGMRESFRESVRNGPLFGNSKDKKYGYFSSATTTKTYKGETIAVATDHKGGEFKRRVNVILVQYLDNKGYDISTLKPYNDKRKVEDFGGKCAFFIAYDKSGKICYMQYTNEGRLVTFDGTSFTVESGGEFKQYDNRNGENLNGVVTSN